MTIRARSCPFCGEQIGARQKECPSCQETLEPPSRESVLDDQAGVDEALQGQVDDELRTSLSHDASAAELSRMARRKGMQLLHEDGLRQVREGITSAAEVLRVARV